MKNTTNQHHKGKKAALLALAFPLVLAGAPVQAAQRTYVASETALPSPQIVGIKRLNPTAVEVLFANNQRMTLDFYGLISSESFKIMPVESSEIRKPNPKHRYW